MGDPVPAVLQVNQAAAQGGAAVVVLALHRALRERGVESVLAVGRRPPPLPGVVRVPQGAGPLWPIHDRLLDADRPRRAHALRSFVRPLALADAALGREDFRFPNTRRLPALLPAGPGVLHLHNLHGDYFDLRALPHLSRTVPTVLTLHDEWAFTGHCAMTLGCGRWLEGCGACPHLDVYPAVRRDGTATTWRRKRAIYEQSRVFATAPSRWLADRARASILGPALVDVVVIPNGIDLDRFRPGDRVAARDALGLSREALVVVFAAESIRTNPFKDWPTLRQGLGLLGSAVGRDVVAVALGADGGGARLGRVELRQLPQVEYADVPGFLQAADVAVHAARAETLGLVVLEALACGLPVVASRVGGIPEAVSHGETGLLVEPGDPHALASALELVLSDDAVRARLGHAAAADAARRFGLERMVDGFVELYREAAATRPD